MADPPASRRRPVARINDLPDDILRNVLSFLSSRDAVRDCMLSRRWRDLWKSVPRIDADITDFDDQGYSDEQCEVLLKRFMNRFLEARDPVPLQEFCLWYSVCKDVPKTESEDASGDDEDAQFAEDDDEEAQFEEDDDEDAQFAEDDDEEAPIAEDDDEEAQLADAPEDDEEAQLADDEDEQDKSADVSEEDEQDKSAAANEWIRYALKHNASVIVVVNRLYALNLDHAGFTSNYLKSLNLSSAILMQGFFEQLQSGCPKLKHLSLYDCVIMDTEVSSQTLEVLTLPDQVHFPPDHQATISAPRLISLAFNNSEGPRLPLLRNMASLEEAWIQISENIKAIDAPDITQFLDSLSRVRRLSFNYDNRRLTMENNCQWCPTFSNLTDLTLDEWCVHEDFYALIVFLQKSPKLKDLTLILNEPHQRFGEEPAIIGALEERSFACNQLESVEIICPSECSLLPKVQTFLLDGGITLDKIRIKQKQHR
ncbi:uncharacterized protein LOC104584768 [Brachypodium distachyon]|uniref:F-box domain-containing protein n=1 Tax=Brachypodium distachyon TaxID=15368 RepID=I1ITZ5_BRADI|nr:uncharacterized protein LOC104584768 [Brachypodium distachyon]XP_010238664.1 uncharacterized protein LOC104584768 [Brachypodium distachyon]KQJ92035.1 hypothetical protein BRADI_4g41367v3 [Brachypodium distachyon]KQJ92036.1 hypothetical protein BRADI_4g41367v3 [Brachypodium distachyon]KQJ92037.1 hypothetical protein BRADI_4g41367v3 [Brachypodium distachyon]KQJ92038.1 hypothetical protein BRADI_4g41367v3 [Brachypodium distachyon]PNT65369.1 hypothetical protein BRADI_4g41367v3 [Brachypodium d|eukprot:XP_010238663.1 uncharacterized protein LOC104584768 [Brachypodium distachyon]